MNYQDYLSQIEKDPEYIKAKEALRLHFALGDAVLHARIRRGWTQTELARRVGTKQANISRIEAAIGNPTLELIKKISDVLEMDVYFAPHLATTTSVKVDYLVSSDAPMPIPSNWPKLDQAAQTSYIQSDWGTQK